jgi:uncharacterized protein (DUF58 family)
MLLIFPTSRGWVFIFAALGSLAIALVNIGLATALTASCLVGFVASSFLLALFSLFRVEVKRGANIDGVKGSKVLLPVVVKNHSFRYRQSMIIREKCPFAPSGKFNSAVPPLAPHEEIVIERQVPAVKRGKYDLKRMTLIGGDPAGLFYRRRHFNIQAEVVIFPEIVTLPWLPLSLKRKAMPEAEGRPLGISGQGQEFFGIREYRHSDEIRFIHWKATAAKKTLMVKEFEANTIDQVTIVLDTFQKDIGIAPEDNNFEFLIKTTASIINYLAELYCRINFITITGPDILIHEMGDSASMNLQVINHLANLTPGKVMMQDLLGDAMDLVPPSSIFYCLSMSEPDDMQKSLEMLLERDIDVRWLYAPKQYFPPIDPEKPRVIKKGKVKVKGNGAVPPILATFKTDIAGVLKND